jgi:hypothetical protein
VSGAIIDAFDQSLTRKGEEDKKNIQLLKAALNEIHSLLMDRKDYPIGAYGLKSLNVVLKYQQNNSQI